MVADGLGAPYQFAVCLASLLYGFAGLVLSYLLARSFVPRFEAATATITLWLGTGVVFYMDFAAAFSHANSLFVLALWLYVWNKTRGWRQERGGAIVYSGGRSIRAWAALGLIGGFAACVREQDGAIMVIAALEALYLYWRGLRKGEGVRRLFVGNVALLIGTLVAFAPQLVIYEWLNGHIGPGKTVGEKISLFSTKALANALSLLVDGNHGMFAWWPVTVLALLGLIILGTGVYSPRSASAKPPAHGTKRLKKVDVISQPFIALLFAVAVAVALYIMGAFQTWTQAGSYGPRRLIGLTPIFAVGLGATLYWLRARLGLGRGWLVALCALFVAWNIGLLFQFAVIRNGASRQELDVQRVVHDQFTEVPSRIVQTGERFIFHRDDLRGNKK